MLHILVWWFPYFSVFLANCVGQPRSPSKTRTKLQTSPKISEYNHKVHEVLLLSHKL